MYYLIKSLKWTKHNGYETWYASNRNGYANRICDAGIYTEEDKNSNWGQASVKEKTIKFIPITKSIINKGTKQVTVELDKLNEWIQKEETRLDKMNEMNELRRKERLNKINEMKELLE